jgi:hypothetical protein
MWKTVGTPASRECHPAIGAIHQRMAKTAELEVNQAQFVVDQEDIIWARIAVDIRKKRPRVLSRVDDRFKASNFVGVGVNAYAVEAGLELLDPHVDVRNILGVCPDLWTNGSEEPFKLRGVANSRRVKGAEASREPEQCSFSAGCVLVQEWLN